MLGNEAFSEKVLDTFGDDVFSRSKDSAVVRCPCHGAWRRILLAAIITDLLIFRPRGNLICQCRDKNGDGVIGRPQSGQSSPAIVQRCVLCRVHRVPSFEWWSDAWPICQLLKNGSYRFF